MVLRVQHYLALTFHSNFISYSSGYIPFLPSDRPSCSSTYALLCPFAKVTAVSWNIILATSQSGSTLLQGPITNFLYSQTQCAPFSKFLMHSVQMI